MPNYTENLNLEKPLQTEFYNVDVQNANMEKIEGFFLDFLNEKEKIDSVIKFLGLGTFGKSSLGADYCGDFYLG